MAIKGQKYMHYPESLKLESIRLHVDEGWRWMRKYREDGQAAFEDRRGSPHRAETEQERELKRLYMEVDV
ncbi:helix-turn-helix domain-containing protein [Cohnella faecalis]|uniref:Helix-turn-helix domain-containing protein n=1 Tax=Cohnella faecalis TaxID=2315694 RepID=A0A398CK21_9BACL|nr:helix-turn-helix domain-containing protein [Cohnella faecalis]